MTGIKDKGVRVEITRALFHFCKACILIVLEKYETDHKHAIMAGGEVDDMDLQKNIAYNLKKIRQQQNISLDMLADQTGVSKSMLGQIERGEANPSIGVLGKITSGLHIELQELTKEPQNAFVLQRQQDLRPVKEGRSQYQIYNLFSPEEKKNFEIYQIEIMTGQNYTSGGHGQHTREYVLVSKGSLQLEVDNAVYTVEEKDSVRFDSDKAHMYRNVGEGMLVLHVVLTF